MKRSSPTTPNARLTVKTAFHSYEESLLGAFIGDPGVPAACGTSTPCMILGFLYGRGLTLLDNAPSCRKMHGSDPDAATLRPPGAHCHRELHVKKLKHEAELFKAALQAGIDYAEGLKAVLFEPTDSASAKALYFD